MAHIQSLKRAALAALLALLVANNAMGAEAWILFEKQYEPLVDARSGKQVEGNRKPSATRPLMGGDMVAPDLTGYTVSERYDADNKMLVYMAIEGEPDVLAALLASGREKKVIISTIRPGRYKTKRKFDREHGIKIQAFNPQELTQQEAENLLADWGIITEGESGTTEQGRMKKITPKKAARLARKEILANNHLE